MKKLLTSPASVVTTLVASALFFAGCGDSSATPDAASPKGGSSSGGSGGSSAEGALSIKYMAEGYTTIFTKNADGSKKRIDTIDSEGEHNVQICDRNGGPTKDGIVYLYEDGEWTELLRSEGDSVNMQAIRTEQQVNNFYSDPVRDLTTYYASEKVGYKKQASQTILGKKCDVYTGVYPDDVSLPRYGALNFKNSEEEIAVWNGLTMRLKYTRTNSDGSKKESIVCEAQAVAFSVPDAIFTKTLDTSWIK